MHILGLNTGHGATACLAVDGRVVSCVSEERFSRIKNHSGVPSQSVTFVLDEAGLSVDDIDLVVLDNNLARTDRFAEQFANAYLHKSTTRAVVSRVGYGWPRLFEGWLRIKRFVDPARRARNARGVQKRIAMELRTSPERVRVIHHHLAHALAPCFNLPDARTLVFTLDGEGDGICASVNVYDGRSLTTLARSDVSASLGYLYFLATLFLGMQPLEHEFKVMGLAPYARPDDVDRVYPVLRRLIWTDDAFGFRSRLHTPFADHVFVRELQFSRFDAVAGAIQRLTEQLTVEWIRKAIASTGIRRVAVSGGVFMNVKANKMVMEMPEIEHLFVMPSCGDESNAVGSCLYGYRQLCHERGAPYSPVPIKSLYLGPSYSNSHVRKLIDRRNLGSTFSITTPDDMGGEIAALLAAGEIVARCVGASEWGARALGNRSILANPTSPGVMRRLNRAIKGRDFWMPFAPSILEESADKYLVNPKRVEAPYMALAFDATEMARRDLPAALHPQDFTLRPQIVYREWNESYYHIISRFNELTGVGAILNTSFNLHGEPIVLTPADALRTVERSDLRYLALGDYLLEKKGVGAATVGGFQSNRNVSP